MILDPAILPAYLAAATALALSPGPDTMFVLASSTSGGPKVGVAATLGIGASGVVHAALAALGISALIAASPLAFDALRIGGAVYLIWIGVKALRSAFASHNDAPGAPRGEGTTAAAFRRGLMTNLMNPKVVVFYVAFLPQFANPAMGHVPLQIFLLGAIHNAIGVIWLTGLALAAGRAAQALARNRRFRAWLDGAAGTVYILLAARMLLLERRPA